MRQLSTVFAAVGLLTLTSLAHAEPFAAVPSEDGQKTDLQIRQVDFSGGASGQIVVEVRNSGKQARTFKARGLYFVPRGDASSAPQRVGAVGPFEVQEGQSWKRKEQLDVEPGKTVKLKLDTYCLDSHRGSPGKGQGYGVASKRLPKELATEIESDAKQMIRSSGGNISAAKGGIQSNVWKSRNKKWIKLEGERANEKSAEPDYKSNSIRRRPLLRKNQVIQQQAE